MMTEIRATFPARAEAKEAEQKLQALRVSGLSSAEDGLSFTASVTPELIDRALYLIEQTGGEAQQSVLEQS
ncbi:hypothetical protein JFN88_17960 [Paenibacillus sp. MAHUQ-46]|uniref:Uncharacterized protein n=2 Tax=Paenibacillus TaxID=44249 RepID=A0A934J1J3_9BACL|nr:hypothetical protein [Paenibacillus roseus]MBJ6363091.1 hypothetical protein [Paenibacillus roseus]